MAFLPSSSLELHGGCLCKAIRYTVSIPALEQRPIATKAITRHQHRKLEEPTRMPFISIDHCESCRVGSGGLVQSWMIMPQAWVNFELQSKDGGDALVRVHAAQDIVTPAEDISKETSLRVFKSSTDVHRTFCGTCGSTLTWACDDNEKAGFGPILDMTVGTLDRDSLVRIKPDRVGWWSDGIPWIRELLRNGDEGLVVNQEGIMSAVVEDV